MSPSSRDRRARRGRRRFYGRRARATISRKARLACDRSMLCALVAVAVGAAIAGVALKFALALVGFTQAGVAAGCIVVGLTTSMTASAMREAGCAATVRDWSEVTAEFLQGLLA